MINLRQFVPSDACLSCCGCCRYSVKETVWAPLFLYEEICELTRKNVVSKCLFSPQEIEKNKPVRINLKQQGDEFFCPCFDTGNNKCGIYQYRPFDCQLYPFLLLRQGAQAFLAVDEKCPYVKEALDTESAKNYIQYLLEFFISSEFKDLLRNNKEIIQEYPGDFKILAPLS